jgi:hypothetical protein
MTLGSSLGIVQQYNFPKYDFNANFDNQFIITDDIVKSWTSNDLVFTNLTDATKIINVKPCVRCGIGSSLRSTTTFNPVNKTYFIAIRFSETSAVTPIIVFNKGNFLQGTVFLAYAKDQLYFMLHRENECIISFIPVLNAIYIIAFTIDSNGLLSIEHPDVSYNKTMRTTLTSDVKLYLGGQVNGMLLKTNLLDIHELIIYNNVLSKSDIDSIKSDLLIKWA